MRIVVDFGLCQGHAVCQGEAPDVFQVTAKGELTVLMEKPDESLRKQVEAAVQYCPTGALSLVDD